MSTTATPHLARRLDPLFSPRTVALIGASDRSPLAKILWNSIHDFGFEGQVFPINPNRKEVFGVTCYPSIDALPTAPDLCVIAVSEQAALGILQECARLSVPGAMLFTLFGSSPDSQNARTKVREFLQQCPMPVAGSGTGGLVNISGAFSALFGPPARTFALHGGISVVSQSGGIQNSLCRSLYAAGVGLDKAVATGGEDQLAASDYIGYLLTQPSTRAIGCVFEQIKDITLFREVFTRARNQDVQIVALPLGRSATGQRAALAHSGSIASDARILEGLLEQVGAISVSNLTEMVNVLSVLKQRKSRRLGRRVGIATVSGGETGLAADLADDHGLQVVDLSPTTTDKLRKILETPETAYQNPVDISAAGVSAFDSDPTIIVEVTEALLNDANTDFVMVRHMEQDGVIEKVADRLKDHPKPLFLYTRNVFDLSTLPGDITRRGLPILPDINLAMAAVAKVARQDEQGGTDNAEGSHATSLKPLDIEFGSGAGLLMEDKVLEILAGIGMKTPSMKVLTPGADIGREIEAIEGPFAVKIISDTIVHRRSAGGVELDLQTREAAKATAEGFFERFGSQASAVVVQSMVKPDIEFFFGAKKAQREGLAIMLGFGGTFIEDFGRLALRLSPLTRLDAKAMIERSGVEAAIRRLAGPDTDRATVRLATLLLSFDELCRHCGDRLAEFDVNPVGFLRASGDFVALDGKLVLSAAEL